jgi:hypothetical protein
MRFWERSKPDAGIIAGFGWEEATICNILGVIFAAGGQRRQTLGFAA